MLTYLVKLPPVCGSTVLYVPTFENMIQHHWGLNSAVDLNYLRFGANILNVLHLQNNNAQVCTFWVFCDRPRLFVTTVHYKSWVDVSESIQLIFFRDTTLCFLMAI